MDLIAALKKLLIDAETEQPSNLGDGEPAVGTDESAAVEPAGTEPETAVDPDPGDGDPTDGDQGPTDDSLGEPGEQETLPDSDTSDGVLRDGMSRLAAENETLRAALQAMRTRLAQLGGDDEIEDGIDVLIDAPAEDPSDDYDDETAQADLDAQAADIERLRG